MSSGGLPPVEWKRWLDTVDDLFGSRYVDGVPYGDTVPDVVLLVPGRKRLVLRVTWLDNEV
jgi:hypothetical protein